MIETYAIETMLLGALPDAKVEVVDTTGTMDHFAVEVTSASFNGRSRLEQHRLVQGCLQAAINDGRIHAISIKTNPK
jgi:stress-induced morphogen